MLVKMATLFGKYTVDKFDGAPFPSNATVEFSAAEGDKVRVHVKVANTMNGQLTNENGKLQGFLMSTMMYGGEGPMALEDAISGGFGSGMAYKVSSGSVTLTSDSHTIVLVSQ